MSARKYTVGTIIIGLSIFFLASCSTMMEYEAKRKAEMGLEIKKERDARKPVKATPSPAVNVKATPDPLAGLRTPTIETQVRKPEQLEVISTQYALFNYASKWVLEQAQAYGIKPQLKNVLLVRTAANFWKEYFQAMQVFPDTPVIHQAEIEVFYGKLGQIDTQTSDTIKSLNTIIDHDRTRPWTRK